MAVKKVIFWYTLTLRYHQNDAHKLRLLVENSLVKSSTEDGAERYFPFLFGTSGCS